MHPPKAKRTPPKSPPRPAARRRELPRHSPRPMPLASAEFELVEDNVVRLPPTRILPDDPQRAMKTKVYEKPDDVESSETNLLPLPPPVPTPHETPVTATLTPVLSPAFLHIDQGPGAGRAIPLPAGELIIGRSSTAGLQLSHASVSRHHVTVRRIADRFFVKDTGSHNGTYLNGRPVIGEVEMFSGDELQLSRVV
ncbi:MAG: FHA domain-containing protein, partial [Myxococcales bacterium]